ncbi:CACNA1D [Symbiodinium sp. CCMP2592]|nr:CACNA1D [Symbiodinium sp. CCMP2592]
MPRGLRSLQRPLELGGLRQPQPRRRLEFHFRRLSSMALGKQKPRLIYLDAKMLAEPIRLALFVGDVDFEDKRVTHQEVQELNLKGQLPFGQVPVLELDGQVFAQTEALLRWAGREAKLYPEEPELQLRCDAVEASRAHPGTCLSIIKARITREECALWRTHQWHPGQRKDGDPQKRTTRVTIAETVAAEIASDGVPEAPRSSLPVHPSGIWDTASNHELVEVLTAQHTEVISRLTAQEEILRRVLMPDAHGKEAGLVSGDNEQMVGSASLCPHPSVSKQTMRSTRSTQRSSRHASRDSEVKPRPSTSPTSPTFFRTFSQIDNSLRYAASAIAASRDRRRFASLRWRADSSEDVGPNCIERIVEAVSFDCFFAVLVLLNCVFIGIEVQHAIDQPDSTPVEFYVVQYSLAFMFTLELSMRLCAYGCREFFCGEDWLWSLLDTFIVLSSIWDIALDLIFLWDASSTATDNPDNPVSSLRALRILRLARIVKAVRLMRVFRFVRALRTLISSIFHTLKSLFWALMLMVLIVYVFGVLFSQAVNSYLLDPENPDLPDLAFEAAQRHYDSLWGTMVSLFMCISGGTNWENVLAPLRAISQLWELLFLFYVAFTYFAVPWLASRSFCLFLFSLLHPCTFNSECRVQRCLYQQTIVLFSPTCLQQP